MSVSVATLAGLVDQLELHADGDELRTAFAVRDRLDARIAVAVAAFEDAGRYEDDGAVSIHGWLRGQTRRDATTAAKTTVTGRKLARLPVLRAAVLDAAISGGQLDIVLAHLPTRHLDRFAAHEADLVPKLAVLDIDRTRAAMDEWKRRADALDDGPPPVERDNQVHLSKTIQNRGELRGSFDSDGTATIAAALRVADSNDFERTLAERRADALLQVCQHFLDHHRTRTGGRHRPHLNVVVDVDGNARYLDTDQPVTPAGLGVLGCDSAYHRVLWSATSGILDYGRATRAWPVDLYNAIAARDGGCRIATCDAPPSWCDVHHVVEWEHGGTTSIDNGLMACRRHHRMVHKPGYRLKLLPDGTTELSRPDGTTQTSHPRGVVSPSLWRRPPGGS